MKKIFFSLFIILTAGAMVTSSPAFGAGRKKAPPPPQAPTIASVTPTAITVKEEKATKTYTITQFTEINVNGQKATVAELKPGMTVNITLTDPTKVARINASGAPK